ncbi:ABC transporter permease [Micromonospora zhanjiangensis]
MNDSVNTWQATRLVAAREIRAKLRDRTFLFSTVLFLFIAIGATVLPALLAGGPSSVAVSRPAVGATLRDAGLQVRLVGDDATAERLVRSGDVDAAVVGTPDGSAVLAMDERPNDVVRALSTSPPVRLLDPDALDPIVAFLVPFAFALVFFMTSQTFGLQIAQSVTEEKQTRIVEILVAAVPVRVLLAGKVIAVGLLALGQIALLVLVTVAGTQFGGSAGILGLIGPALGWFVPFFLVGFVLLAALWAVAGALANRQEDLAGVSMPVQLLVMLPFFAVLFLNDNPTAMRILSYVPFSAPTAMPLRLFNGDAAGWEPVVALLVLLATAAGALIVGERLYEGSLLRTNGRTSLRTAWRERA